MEFLQMKAHTLSQGEITANFDQSWTRSVVEVTFRRLHLGSLKNRYRKYIDNFKVVKTGALCKEGRKQHFAWHLLTDNQCCTVKEDPSLDYINEVLPPINMKWPRHIKRNYFWFIDVNKMIVKHNLVIFFIRVDSTQD